MVHESGFDGVLQLNGPYVTYLRFRYGLLSAMYMIKMKLSNST